MIVIDTHTLLWWVYDNPELSIAAKSAIDAEQPSGDIIVSSISAWEIALLLKRKRICLPVDLASWLASVSNLRAVRFMPIDVDIARKTVNLPGEFHKDPADRFIVATARKLAVSLVTKDKKIRAYPHVATIW